MQPGEKVIWNDPGGRVVHELGSVDEHNATMCCGAIYPAPQVEAFDEKRHWWRSGDLCRKCATSKDEPSP